MKLITKSNDKKILFYCLINRFGDEFREVFDNFPLKISFANIIFNALNFIIIYNKL